MYIEQDKIFEIKMNLTITKTKWLLDNSAQITKWSEKSMRELTCLSKIVGSKYEENTTRRVVEINETSRRREKKKANSTVNCKGEKRRCTKTQGRKQ